MAQRKSKSIFSGLPLEWKEKSDDNMTPPESDDRKTEEPSDEPPHASGNTGNAPKSDEADIKKNKSDQKEGNKKSAEKKAIRQKEKRYRKNVEELTGQYREKHRKEFQIEQAQNRRDMIIIASTVTAIICFLAVFIVFFSDSGSQKIEALISEGNYALAFSEIEERYEQGKNVDRLVYSFSESCLRDRKYSNAVEPIRFLSENAQKHCDFFEGLVSELAEHDKMNLGKEVLAYMTGQGGSLEETARKLKREYAALN